MLRFLKYFWSLLPLPAVTPTADAANAPTINGLQGRIDNVINNWPAGTPFRVERVLERFPEFRTEPRALIEFAIEEYTQRVDSGEQLSPQDFAQFYPDIESALLNSIVVDRAMRPFTGWPVPPEMSKITWPKVGQTIERLKLLEPLGNGGFSQVFLAEDLDHHSRKVAVKICLRDTHEVQTLNELQHSAIGLVHYVRELPDSPLIAICMPMVSRTTLGHIIESAWKPLGSRVTRAFPRNASTVLEKLQLHNKGTRTTTDWARQSFVDWVISIAIQVARGLEASHARGVIHCDIKPSNLLITLEGLAILVDFNVAFKQSATHSPANIGGTVPYMSPEHIGAFAGTGSPNIGPSSDIFGFGATFYQLLTGLLPFGFASKDADPVDVLKSRGVVPSPIRASNPLVDKELEALILQCLSFTPNGRPKSAADIARRLERIQEHRRTARASRRERQLQAGAGLLTTALGIALAVAVRNSAEDPKVKAVDLAPSSSAIVEVVKEPQASDIVDEGYSHFKDREFESAIGKFEAALAIDEEHFGARLGLARALGCMGQVKRAERELDRLDWLSAREPSEIRAFRCFCRLQTARLPDELKAIDDTLKEIRASGLSTSAVVSNHATCMMKLQQPDEALRHATRALHLDPSLQPAKVISLIALINLKASRGQPLTNFEFESLAPVLSAEYGEPYFAWVVADSASGFAMINQQTNPRLAETLRQFASTQFQNAVKQDSSGEIVKVWPRIKNRFSGETLEQLAPLVSEIEPDAKAVDPQKKPFLVDPLAASRFEHYADRDFRNPIDVQVSLAR